MASEQVVELTIRLTDESLGWAIKYVNDFIASKPVNTEPVAHAFVSALSNPVGEKRL